jgi:DNA-binding MarR family transcriptional regulator
MAAQPPVTDDDRLVFVLARHGQVINARLRQALVGCGFSPRHGAVLMRLAAAGPTSQQSLLEALAVDASALVAVLNDLEGGGLVERRRDPSDRRRHIVEITTLGRQKLDVVDTAVVEVEREAFAGLTADEVSHLHALLLRVGTLQDGAACGED